jgi:NTE family protein
MNEPARTDGTRRRWLLAAAAGAAVAAGPAEAATPAGKPAPNASANAPLNAQANEPPRRPAGKGPAKLAVVLGAGAARGFAHIGVIKALDAAGIRPDLIVGCSAGALVGAFWATGLSGQKLEQLAQTVRDEDVIDLMAGTSNGRYGLISGQLLQNFVNDSLSRRTIETLQIPLQVVATTFPSGELQVFRHGDTGFAVRASCSVPGIFMPAESNGQTFVDGGLVSPLPVQTARAGGADLVVAVDIGGPDPGACSHTSNAGLFKMLLRSFDIMGESLRRHEAAGADIVIRPDVARIASTDFAARRALVEAGFQAGQRLAPVIAEKLRLPRR